MQQTILTQTAVSVNWYLIINPILQLRYELLQEMVWQVKTAAAITLILIMSYLTLQIRTTSGIHLKLSMILTPKALKCTIKLTMQAAMNLHL